MNEIKRYSHDDDMGFSNSFQPDDDGPWMKYADHANPDCVWGQGECIPDCPSCKRMDDLYGEWCKGHVRGYTEGYGAAMDDGWGEPGHIEAAIKADRAEWDRGSDAYQRGYMKGAEDEGSKWSQPSMYDEGRWKERERVVAIIKDYYKVAPKAADPLLRLIDIKGKGA